MISNLSRGLISLTAGVLLSAGCATVRADGLTGDAAAPPRVVSAGSVNLHGQEVAYTVRTTTPLEFPGWVDSNSPAYWDDGRLVIFNSAYYPTRTTGSSLDTLGEPVDVENLGLHRGGGWWIEAVWPDPETGVLYGWYHLEPDDLECLTAPFIGAAVSYDGGESWLDLGPVLDSDEPIDCSYDNGYFAGGHGDFSVILDQQGEYFYFLYSNYSGSAEEQGVALARSAFEDRGQPGTTSKYFNGAWDEPGLGGRADAIFPTGTGWAGPQVDAFWGPSVHWNEYLGVYVTLLNHAAGYGFEQEGIYITLSRDLIEWTEPQRLMDADQWYPQAMGLEPGGTDRNAGKLLRLYVSGVSDVVLEFDAPGALVEESL